MLLLLLPCGHDFREPGKHKKAIFLDRDARRATGQGHSASTLPGERHMNASALLVTENPALSSAQVKALAISGITAKTVRGLDEAGQLMNRGPYAIAIIDRFYLQQQYENALARFVASCPALVSDLEIVNPYLPDQIREFLNIHEPVYAAAA